MMRVSTNMVKYWWLALILCVLLMIFIGGLTRLTESGLSMVNWHPITGWLPPLTDEAWEAEFSAYKLSPEYRMVNHGMSPAAFKSIFYMEYFHRLMGRITGLVLFIPLLYFIITRKLPTSLWRYLLLIGILGGMQGGVGWYMVQSGLADHPYVSPYRLAMHLGFAMVIYLLLVKGYIVHFTQKQRDIVPTKLVIVGGISCGLIFVQMLSGAFVAGLDAGRIYNEFPLMGGKWIPEGMWYFVPWYRNFLENPEAVQWLHRVFAVIVSGWIIGFWILSQFFSNILPKKISNTIHLLLFMLLLQLMLGIATLLYDVPIGLASLHQLGAVALFTVAICVTTHLSNSNR